MIATSTNLVYPVHGHKTSDSSRTLAFTRNKKTQYLSMLKFKLCSNIKKINKDE